MKKRTGVAKCLWIGRRLPWWIAVGYHEFMAELRTSTSARLQTLLARLSPDKRGRLTAAMQDFRVNLIDWYQDKFDFCFKLPIYFVGAFYGAQGGDLSQSRDILSECVREVDAAIARGEGHRLNRIIRKHLLPGCRFRSEAEAFIASDQPLEDFPYLYVVLQEYGLIPFVERRNKKFMH